MNQMLITGRNKKFAIAESLRFGVPWGKDRDSRGIYYYLVISDQDKREEIRAIWEKEHDLFPN